MLVERVWAANDLLNFHYLIACPETGEALAIDPLEWERCLAVARDKGWEITQILNTHEHRDHTAGNGGMVNATGAKVLAHEGAASRIGGVDRGLRKGDVIKVGRTVELESLDTPGHTMTHVCLFAHTGQPALFCGDTLFNAGVGNCHNGGDPAVLYQTFATQISRLPDATQVHPGHEYLTRNLEFTLDREPGNAAAAEWLATSKAQNAATAPVTTKLRETFPDIGEKPDARTVFLKLRELRNRW
jgi:hydroxyacylglutathione hydrolase